MIRKKENTTYVVGLSQTQQKRGQEEKRMSSLCSS